MKYEVKIYVDSNTNTLKFELENVRQIQIHNGVYNIHSDSNQVLFSSPVERVVYARKL